MRHLIPATLALIAVMFVVTQADAGTDSTAPTSCSSAEKQVVNLYNQRRAQQSSIDGVTRKPLVVTEALCQASELRCQELKQKFSHYRPNGSWWGSVLQQFGIVYQRGVEFLLLNFYADTPAEIVQKWWDAPTDPATGVNRRTEILRPKNRQAAAGLCYPYAASILVNPP